MFFAFRHQVGTVLPLISIGSLNLRIRYVPYGALSEVMPYLSRRAIENTSVLGGTNGALEERKVAGYALWQRIWGGAT